MFFAGLAVMLLGTWPLKACWLEKFGNQDGKEVVSTKPRKTHT